MWVISVLYVSVATLSGIHAAHHQRRDPCRDVICPPGHECTVSEHNLGQCSCTAKCGFGLSLLCGTNNVTYDNECFMYRESCLTGNFIELSHRGPCTQYDVASKIRNRPVVCFQRERDFLREHLVHIIKYEMSKTHKIKNYKRLVKLRFNICDNDGNDQITSQEFLECFRDEVTQPVRTDENGDLVLTLCLDAILNAGDRNLDMELNLGEFRHLMRPDFKTVVERCSLEGKYYDDGAETSDRCSFCVCASGNWVCTKELSCSLDDKAGNNNLEKVKDKEDTDDNQSEEDDIWSKEKNGEEYDDYF